jgi:hypothetical protein
MSRWPPLTVSVSSDVVVNLRRSAAAALTTARVNTDPFVREAMKAEAAIFTEGADEIERLRRQIRNASATADRPPSAVNNGEEP